MGTVPISVSEPDRRGRLATLAESGSRPEAKRPRDRVEESPPPGLPRVNEERPGGSMIAQFDTMKDTGPEDVDAAWPEPPPHAVRSAAVAAFLDVATAKHEGDAPAPGVIVKHRRGVV